VSRSGEGISEWLRRAGSALAELCYPVCCWGCGRVWPGPGELLCQQCHSELVDHGLLRCGRCGQFVGPGALVGGGCWECRDRRFAFASAVATVPYGKVAQDMVHRFKYNGHGYLARVMAELMAGVAVLERLDVLCDVVAAVPLHWSRRLTRGFDQAAVLASEVGARVALPVAGRLLVRTRATLSQAGLSRRERVRNVAESFAVRASAEVMDRTVLLIDDVLTTGATADACARAFESAGCRRVFVLTFARAGKPIPAGVSVEGRGEDV